MFGLSRWFKGQRVHAGSDSAAPIEPKLHVGPAEGKSQKPGSKEVYWSYNGVTVLAMTKSEARSTLKRAFGLKRLPAGAVVERFKAR